ncbi:MAG: PorV/PorQ family protein [Deltaproteobacteria bacterium]|nr:PorV/PorQ family protein [Deltaproteobacteria bacterium]
MNIAIFKRLFPVILVILLAGGDVVMAQDGDDIDWGIHAWEYSRVGKSGWQFLKIPTNARYAAMGGIITATGRGDASSALGNPASMADVENISASVTGMNWIADVKYMSGAVAKNLGNWGVFGLNVIAVDYGDMERTENQEQFDDFGETLGRAMPVFGLGTFTGGDFSIGLSYARRMTDKLQVGLNARFVQETLDDATTSNWAIDIGTIYYTGIKTFRISMVGRNFGPDAEFVGYSERIAEPAMKVRMPMVFLLGAAIDIIEQKEGSPHYWTLAAEFTHPNDGPEKVNVGTEYSFMNFVMLRGGYRFNYDEEGLTLGAGLRVHFSDFSFLLNYAYIDFGRLSKVHMFSTGFSF